MGEAGEWRGGVFRTTWLAGTNPHRSTPITVTVTTRFIGQQPRPWSATLGPGERWELNLADVAPMPLWTVHNAVVTIECSVAWCPAWATIYAEPLKRGVVASHPDIKWGCPQ